MNALNPLFERGVTHRYVSLQVRTLFTAAPCLQALDGRRVREDHG